MRILIPTLIITAQELWRRSVYGLVLVEGAVATTLLVTFVFILPFQAHDVLGSMMPLNSTGAILGLLVGILGSYLALLGCLAILGRPR